MKYRIFKDGKRWRVTHGSCDFGTWRSWDGAMYFVTCFYSGKPYDPINWGALRWDA